MECCINIWYGINDILMLYYLNVEVSLLQNFYNIDATFMQR